MIQRDYEFGLTADWIAWLLMDNELRIWDLWQFKIRLAIARHILGGKVLIRLLVRQYTGGLTQRTT